MAPLRSTTPPDFAAVSSGATTKVLKHKRRYCRTPGCNRIVKSQGLCQRHGAKPKMCRIEGCTKQAQGNFDKMCKSHYKQYKNTPMTLECQPIAESTSSAHALPAVRSIYESVLPSSLGWKADSGTEMPLIEHLRGGFEAGKPPAWHRNEERQARGLSIVDQATQLEGWERELVWTEILMLTGITDTYQYLARGWGQEDGFHNVLTQFICGQRGTAAGSGVEGAGNWASDCYGDGAQDEALAADVFDVSPDFVFEGLEEDLENLSSSSSEEEGSSSSDTVSTYEEAKDADNTMCHECTSV